MEFTITCPIDGIITVSLEDIDSVVLRESERADVTFVCPQCGSEISMTGIVPSFLLHAIQAIADEAEGIGHHSVSSADSYGLHGSAGVSDTHDTTTEAYCEYFRRQLAHVNCVEDALAEIDTRIR